MHSVTIATIYFLILHNQHCHDGVTVGRRGYCEVTGAGVTASWSCTFRLFSSCVPPVQKPLKCFKTSPLLRSFSYHVVMETLKSQGTGQISVLLQGIGRIQRYTTHSSYAHWCSGVHPPLILADLSLRPEVNGQISPSPQYDSCLPPFGFPKQSSEMTSPPTAWKNSRLRRSGQEVPASLLLNSVKAADFSQVQVKNTDLNGSFPLRINQHQWLKL